MLLGMKRRESEDGINGAHKWKVILAISLKVHTGKCCSAFGVWLVPTRSLKDKTERQVLVHSQVPLPAFPAGNRSPMLRASLVCMHHVPFAVFLQRHDQKPAVSVNMLRSPESQTMLSLEKRHLRNISAMCSYIWGGGRKKLTVFQDKCQHLGFSLLRSQVASTALLSPYTNISRTFHSALSTTAFWEERAKEPVLIFFYSNQVYFLFINIYIVHSESFCINSNFKIVLDIKHFYIWDTTLFWRKYVMF